MIRYAKRYVILTVISNNKNHVEKNDEMFFSIDIDLVCVHCVGGSELVTPRCDSVAWRLS